MTSLIRKPLFWTNIVTISITGVMVAGLAFAWTNPSATPPGGSGAVSVDSTGKVGVGTTAPTQKLDINGYLVSRTGFCLGLDDLTAAASGGSGGLLSTTGGLTSLSSAVLTATHSTYDSSHRVFPVGHSTTLSAMHDSLISAGYTDKSTLRTSSESGYTTLAASASSGGLTVSGSGSASGVSTTAYKAIGCRTTWPAPGVGVEKSSSGVSFGTPKTQLVNKNRLAKFVSDTPGQETIGNSNINDDGSTVSVTGNFSFSGTLVGGAIPWGNISAIPKIDCGAGKVLQGVFPTKCVTLAGGSAPAPAPSAGPASCTSSIPGTGPGPTSGTAICGLSCTKGAPTITSYTGSGTPYVSGTSPDYVCNGKYTVGPSSITCTCP